MCSRHGAQFESLIDKNVQLTCMKNHMTFFPFFFPPYSCCLFIYLFIYLLFSLPTHTMDEHKHTILVILVFIMIMHRIIEDMISFQEMTRITQY